jgi:hypothetical protein
LIAEASWSAMRSSANATGSRGLGLVTAKTSSARRLMIVARGSYEHDPHGGHRLPEVTLAMSTPTRPDRIESAR